MVRKMDNITTITTFTITIADEAERMFLKPRVRKKLFNPADESQPTRIKGTLFSRCAITVPENYIDDSFILNVRKTFLNRFVRSSRSFLTLRGNWVALEENIRRKIEWLMCKKVDIPFRIQKKNTEKIISEMESEWSDFSFENSICIMRFLDHRWFKWQTLALQSIGIVTLHWLTAPTKLRRLKESFSCYDVIYLLSVS